MPFIKHFIEPINIAECKVPNEKNEFECLSNSTLSNIIRQLSSIGEHANSLFSELIQDSANMNNRTKVIIEKIENLKRKFVLLNNTGLYNIIVISFFIISLFLSKSLKTIQIH